MTQMNADENSAKASGAQSFSGLKGRHVKAQGNALGPNALRTSSPERASQSSAMKPDVAPFQGWEHFRPFFPRALPWAFTSRPVGAEELLQGAGDFGDAHREGGLGKMYQLFGDRMEPLIAELNEALVA